MVIILSIVTDKNQLTVFESTWSGIYPLKPTNCEPALYRRGENQVTITEFLFKSSPCRYHNHYWPEHRMVRCTSPQRIFQWILLQFIFSPDVPQTLLLITLKVQESPLSVLMALDTGTYTLCILLNSQLIWRFTRWHENTSNWVGVLALSGTSVVLGVGPAAASSPEAHAQTLRDWGRAVLRCPVSVDIWVPEAHKLNSELVTFNQLVISHLVFLEQLLITKHFARNFYAN